MNNDLISREWLRTAVTKMFGDSDIASSIDAIIDNAPTVEEKSYAMGYQDGLEDGLDGIIPKGEWRVFYTPKMKKVFKCDKCMAVSIQGQTNFCPNCGAKMKGGAENDT